MVRERLRGHVVALMAKHGMHPARFAKRTGIGSGALSDILSGKKPIGLETLVKVHRAFPSESLNEWMDVDADPAVLPTGATGVPVRQPYRSAVQEAAEERARRAAEILDVPPEIAAELLRALPSLDPKAQRWLVAEARERAAAVEGKPSRKSVSDR